MAGTTRVEGADNLARTLRAASRDIKQMERANKAAGDQIANRARAAAPRRTGRLAASISASTSGSTAIIQATAPYAAVINYGSRKRGITGRPFLTGQTKNVAAWLPVYKRELDKALTKVRGI